MRSWPYFRTETFGSISVSYQYANITQHQKVLQWQCMERAGIEESVLERIRNLQQSMQGHQMRTIKNSIGDAIESLCRQLSADQEVTLSDVAGWFGH